VVRLGSQRVNVVHRVVILYLFCLVVQHMDQVSYSPGHEAPSQGTEPSDAVTGVRQHVS
jgi:hypothetical protein